MVPCGPGRARRPVRDGVACLVPMESWGLPPAVGPNRWRPSASRQWCIPDRTGPHWQERGPECGVRSSWEGAEEVRKAIGSGYCWL